MWIVRIECGAAFIVCVWEDSERCLREGERKGKRSRDA